MPVYWPPHWYSHPLVWKLSLIVIIVRIHRLVIYTLSIHGLVLLPWCYLVFNGFAALLVFFFQDWVSEFAKRICQGKQREKLIRNILIKFVFFSHKFWGKVIFLSGIAAVLMGIVEYSCLYVFHWIEQEDWLFWILVRDSITNQISPLKSISSTFLAFRFLPLLYSLLLWYPIPVINDHLTINFNTSP